jgi:hypothetical protein
MRKRYFLTLALLGMLTACMQSAPVRLGEPRFTGPAFQFASNAIEVQKSADVPAEDIQSRYSFPTRLDSGVEQWARDRLHTRGGNNRVVVDILEASVVEEELPITKGFMGMFKKEQSRRYTGKLRVQLAVYSSERATVRAGAESQAEQMITLREDVSLAERQQAFNDLVIALLQQMDTQLSQQIPEHFKPYLLGY